MPFFGPVIRKPCVFRKDANLKKFLLSKLINAEYASLKAPAFSSFSEKTLEQSLLKLSENLEDLTNSFTCHDFTNYGNTLINFSPNNGFVQNPASSITSQTSTQGDESNNSFNLPLITNTQTSNNPNIKGVWRKFSTAFLGVENISNVSKERTPSFEKSKKKHSEKEEV